VRHRRTPPSGRAGKEPSRILPGDFTYSITCKKKFVFLWTEKLEKELINAEEETMYCITDRQEIMHGQ
jgi:hypothetical protein